MTVPWYYIWTPKYEIFHKVLSSGIASYGSVLENKNVFMTQEEFNASMNKLPGHFLTGCSLKLQKTVELLNTLPENSYFIFSDADIILFPGKVLEDLLNFYMKQNAGIVFMREAPCMSFSNVGFSLIRVCEANRKLFKDALEKFKTEPTGLDGSFVNECLKSYTETHFHFPFEFVATSSTLIDMNKMPQNMHKMVGHLIVFQALCNPEHGVDNGIQQKLLQYKMLGINTVTLQK